MAIRAENDRGVIEAQRRLGHAVATRRTQLGLSQEQFAARVCVDRTYVSKIERGLGFPARPVALSIAALAPKGSDDFMVLWAEVEHRRRQLNSDSRGAKDPDSLIEEFATFVGQEIARDEVCLVYPVFSLAREARERLDGLNPQRLYEKEHTPFSGRTYRIDVPLAAAANDVQALLYVSELLGRYLPIRTQMRRDDKVLRDCACSFFSFGLSSNYCTHMYLATARKKLFDVIDDGHGSEYLQLADGTEYRSTSSSEYGIIVRTRPDPQDHPDRAWFFCAGLGPQATPGAAWYLASNWQSLHRRVGTSDFVAVVDVGCHSSKSAKLQHILISDS